MLTLSPDKLQFVHIDSLDGTQVWCQLSMVRCLFHFCLKFSHVVKQMLFENMRIESQANNQIGLSLDMDDLMRALKSAQTAAEIQLRLTKPNGQPCLAFYLQVSQVRKRSLYDFLAHFDEFA